MIIGSFSYDDKTDTYFGEINTFTLQRRNVVIRPSGMTGDREPSHRVVIETDGGAFELGAAWRKTSERGGEYLSILLDDPAFPARCDAALFTDMEGRTARLVWQRPKPMPAPRPDAKPTRPAAKQTKRREPSQRPSAS